MKDNPFDSVKNSLGDRLRSMLNLPVDTSEEDLLNAIWFLKERDRIVTAMFSGRSVDQIQKILKGS